jgi:hypothetical protein
MEVVLLGQRAEPVNRALRFGGGCLEAAPHDTTSEA